MTKRKVKFTEDTEVEEERPASKSRRFKVQDLDNDGRWVEVKPHPVLSDVFTCNTCAKSLSPRTAPMRHLHWCLYEDRPASPEATRVISSGTSKTNKNYSEQHMVIIEETSDRHDRHSPEVPERSAAIIPDVVVNTPTSAERKHRGGADTRRKYTNIEKVQILTEVNSGGKPMDVAYKYGINRSLISKWMQKKDFLMKIVATPDKGNDTKNRRKFKYEKLFIELNNRYLKAKEDGVQINHRWVYNCANEINKEKNPEASALPSSVTTKFMKEYNVQITKKIKSESIITASIEGQTVDNGSSTSTETPHIVMTPGGMSGTQEQVPLSFAIDLKNNYESSIANEIHPPTSCSMPPSS